MLNKSISYSNSISAGIILLIALLYAITSGLLTISPITYISQPAVEAWTPSAIGGLLLDAQTNHPTISHIIAIVMIVAGAINIMFTTIRHNLYGKATHLPMVIYLALCAALSTPNEILAPPFIALLLSLSIGNLYDTYGHLDLSHKLFAGIFYLGCTLLIYPSAILFAPLVIVALVLFERSGRELLVATAALLTPIAFQLYVTWLLGYSFEWQIELYREAFFSYRGGVAGALNSVILVALYLPVAIYALYNIEEISIALMARKRTLYSIIIPFLAIPMLFVPSFTPPQLLILAAPISIFTITAITEAPERWAPTAYIVTIAIALLIRFIPI